jgi:hypothetical protein
LLLPVCCDDPRNGRFADAVKTCHFGAGFAPGHNGLGNLATLLVGEFAPAPADPPLMDFEREFEFTI